MRIRRIVRAVRLLAMPAFATAALLGSGCSRSTRPIVGNATPLSRVVVAPDTDSLRVGQKQQFTAVAFDTSGNADPNVGVAWSSLQPRIASVSPNGLVTAQAEGVAQVVAASGNKSDTAMVYVTALQSGWVIQASNTLDNLNGVWFQADGQAGCV